MAGRVSVLFLAGCFLAKLLLGSTGSATVFNQPGNSSFSTQQNSTYWVSENGECTFGFKSISADEYLLSVWFTNDQNKTSLWWPAKLKDSDNPVVKTGAILNFTSQGSLELSDATSNVIWSSGNISSVAFAELQDTGNLVLLDKRKGVLWQSFADLRDSLMLPKHIGGSADVAMVINKPYLLQSRENKTSYISGRFHLATDYQQNLYLHALYQHHNVDFIYMYASMNVSANFEIGQDYGKTFYSNGSMPVSRLTLDEDGNLRIYSWEASARSWQEIWQIVDDKCKLGSPCGPFGICDEVAGGRIKCTCPPGYHAIDVHDNSQGCGSSINFSASCGGAPSAGGMSGEFSMVEMASSDYYYNDLGGGQPDVGIEQCKTLCLNKCTCMAASQRNDNTCFLKGNGTTGYLMNGYSTDGNTLLIKVLLVADASGSGVKTGAVIGVGVAGGLVVTAIVCVARLLWRRRSGRTVGEEQDQRPDHLLDVADAGPVRFTYQKLVEATNNFSDLLGEGGSGKVYKGWMEKKRAGIGSTERVAVAVKVLKGGSATEQEGAKKAIRDAERGEKQFRAEVSTLGKIHHVNLVSLLGYCSGGSAGERRALVFEYMENGSLDRFLSGSAAMQKPLQLAWATRYSIALGTARGIAYLHHDCSPRILHCDIKPQNVLIDHDFAPKVADLGFARRFRLRESHLTISGMRGTRGYMAPEWLTSDEVTSKVDVFSFGMLLLELVRGPNVVNDRVSLLDWAFRSISAGVILPQEAAAAVSDEDMNVGEPVHVPLPDQQVALEQLRLLRIGLWCIQYMPSMRPAMSRVVQLIEGTVALEDPPNPAPQQMTITTRLPSFLSDREQTSTSYVNSPSYANSNSVPSPHHGSN